MKDPRRAAVAALVRQEKDGYANIVLHHALRAFDGTPQDRAFFTALFYGTVERRVTLDWLLQQCLARPLARLDAEVRAILRCGLYQARHMDGVPVRAAVYESVALTRRMGKASAAGLVNAVLRRAASIDLSSAAFSDETQRLSVLYSVSRPIAALLREKCPDRCEDILRASFTPPPLCVRVNTLRTGRAALIGALAAEGVTARAAPLADSLYLETKGDITRLAAFGRGEFHVQGLASQLACAALGAKPGEKVLDLCAAPGGKSATLAQQMQSRGALFVRDAAENRLSLIEDAFRRLGVCGAHIACADAAVYDARLAGADAVLCDVPCSGLGVLAKKPDLRGRSLETLPALCGMQRAILETASRYVKPGGRLVYSTCTLNPDENEGAVRPFLARHPEFSAAPLPAALPGASEDGHLVTLCPPRTGTDGFFIALLKKQ